MSEIPMPELNSSIFSSASIQGIIILIILFFIIKESSKKFVDLAFRIGGFIFIMQILYIIGQSPLDRFIGISMVFKYDFFSAIAQLIPGTKLAEWLMIFGNMLSNFLLDLVYWAIGLPGRFLRAIR